MPSSELNAASIMIRRVVTLSPEMDVYEAIDLLLQNHISGAPVVDPEGNLIGIFSEKDCMRVLIDGAYNNLPTATVASFMVRQVRSIPEDLDLLSITQIFLSTSYRRLPVVREGKVVGQISRRDLLQAAAKLLRATDDGKPSFLFLSRIADRKDAPI